MKASTLRTASLLLLLAFAQSTAIAQTVPGMKRDLDFDAHVGTVDLDDPNYRLEYKKPTSDGSSIGLFIGVGNQPTDRSFVPTNASSIPEAEVVAYRLSRFLGVSRLYYPVAYYKLGPKATALFAEMVRKTRETSEDRISNRDMVLKDLAATPGTILGIYRLRPRLKLSTALTLGSSGEFNESTGLAQEIRASGRMPDTSMLSLREVKAGRSDFPSPPAEQRVELARQLSTIFVVDQLLGQWDRFWNNLEATGDRHGRLKLVARDNGGATLDDWEGYDGYSRWVSRFDRDVISRLAALNKFLKGEVKEFAGYSSVDAWRDAVGFIHPASYATFARKLGKLIDERVPALTKRHGDKVYFPPKSAEIAKLDAADSGEDD